MITRIKDEDGVFRVTILSADGPIDERATSDLSEAFAWQSYAQANGTFPVVPAPVAIHEPEVTKAKGKKK